MTRIIATFDPPPETKPRYAVEYQDERVVMEDQAQRVVEPVWEVQETYKADELDDALQNARFIAEVQGYKTRVIDTWEEEQS